MLVHQRVSIVDIKHLRWVTAANSPRNPTPSTPWRHSNPGGWPDPTNDRDAYGGWFLWIRPVWVWTTKKLSLGCSGMFLYYIHDRDDWHGFDGALMVLWGCFRLATSMGCSLLDDKKKAVPSCQTSSWPSETTMIEAQWSPISSWNFNLWNVLFVFPLDVPYVFSQFLHHITCFDCCPHSFNYPLVNSHILPWNIT